MVTIDFKNGESITIDETKALIRGGNELTFYISNRRVVIGLAGVVLPLPKSIEYRGHYHG
jgi:hypothetical protein